MGIVLLLGLIAYGHEGPAPREGEPLAKIASLIEGCRQGDASARQQLERLFLPDDLKEESPDLSPAAEPLRSLLADPDAQNRLVAANCLGELGRLASATRPALIPLLHDPDVRVQFAAACALLRCAPRSTDRAAEKARDLVIEQTKDRFFGFYHQNVPRGKNHERYELLGALGPRALGMLVGELERADNTNRSSLIRDFYHVGFSRKPDEEWTRSRELDLAVAALKAYLDDADPVMQLAAAQALAGLREPSPKAAALLLAKLHDPGDLEYSLDEDLLGNLGTSARAAIPVLEARLDQVPNGYLCQVASCLSQIDPANLKAKRALLRILKAPEDNGFSMSSSAAFSLGQLGEAGRDTIPDLIEATSSRRRDLAISAHGALLQLDPTWDVPMAVLIDGLNDPDYHVGLVAIEVLKRLGPRGRAAIPALLEARHGRVRYLREAAQAGLEAVRREPSEKRP